MGRENYVNFWILHAIYTGPFDDALVFKGGTALSKLYFPDVWRFSEDLDFTATEPLPDMADDIGNALTGIEPASGITFEDATIATALHDKAAAHNVDLDLANGTPEDDIDAVQAYCDQALDRLVTDHIPFDDVGQIDTYLKELTAHSVE